MSKVNFNVLQLQISSRSAFAITETELKLIANGIIGESKDQKDINPCRNRFRVHYKRKQKINFIIFSLQHDSILSLDNLQISFNQSYLALSIATSVPVPIVIPISA
jgi:hypothetical protein